MLSTTENFRRILLLARDEANKYHHTCITSEHMFAGILQLPDTSGAIRVLLNLGLEIGMLKTELAIQFGQIPEDGPLSAESFSYSPAAKKLIATASRQSRRLHAGAMGSEHILLALTLEEESTLKLIFEKIGLEARKVETAIQELPEFAPNS